MDLEPERRDRAMARWTLVGSFGYVAGPGLLVAAIAAGVGWRGALAALGVAALPLVLAARGVPSPAATEHTSFRASVAALASSLRRREVLRWLIVLEAADLLGDVFHGFLALYVVDVLGHSTAQGALAVAVWTGAALVGDALLLVVIRRLDPLRYLRATALAALAVYPAFLLAPGFGARLALVAVLGLLNSGWYALPQARLYGSLPGRSGAAVAVGGIGGLLGATLPAILGVVAGSAGLAPTMWLLLAAPLALLALVPPHEEPGHEPDAVDRNVDR
jgi:FSR family fosmidomycin resistance protein-like MFS transporter